MGVVRHPAYGISGILLAAKFCYFREALSCAGTLIAEGVLDDFLDETPEAEALEAASRIARQKVLLRNSTRQQIGPQNDPEKSLRLS
jgi:hypothetical protein